MRPLVLESLLDLVENRSSRKQAKLRSPIGAERGSRVTPKGRPYGRPQGPRTPVYSGSLLPAVIPQKPELPDPGVLNKKPDSNRFIRNPLVTTDKPEKNPLALRSGGPPALRSGGPPALRSGGPLALRNNGEKGGRGVDGVDQEARTKETVTKKEEEPKEKVNIRCFRMPSATFGTKRVGS